MIEEEIMTTKATGEKPCATQNKRQLFRLALAALSTFLLCVGLLAGAFNRVRTFGVHASGNEWRQIVPALAQPQTAMPTPTFLGLSPSPPPPHDPSSQNTFEATATSGQVYIGFDRFPSGALVPPRTPITNQYPPAVFSSDTAR